MKATRATPVPPENNDACIEHTAGRVSPDVSTLISLVMARVRKLEDQSPDSPTSFVPVVVTLETQAEVDWRRELRQFRSGVGGHAVYTTLNSHITDPRP